MWGPGVCISNQGQHPWRGLEAALVIRGQPPVGVQGSTSALKASAGGGGGGGGGRKGVVVVSSCISNQGSASCWGPGGLHQNSRPAPLVEGGGRGVLGAASVIRSQHPAGVWGSTSAIKTTTSVGI